MRFWLCIVSKQTAMATDEKTLTTAGTGGLLLSSSDMMKIELFLGAESIGEGCQQQKVLQNCQKGSESTVKIYYRAWSK